VNHLLDDLCSLATEAGDAILDVARTPVESRAKADASPVTLADEAADRLILAGLHRLAPEIEVISEESITAARIGGAFPDRFWLVDPLDGTKEFLKGNGEYTVNIALVEDGVPVLGVVHAPASDWTYAAGGGQVFRRQGRGAASAIAARPCPARPLALVSRSHRDAKTDDYLRRLGDIEERSVGSSLKFCLLAAGEGDLYARFGRTMEWDTAAGHAILAAAGGSVCTLDGAPLRYGKAGLENPDFIARGKPAL
jgi:3'(2'), 5'-bisphosphate nucleotidase